MNTNSRIKKYKSLDEIKKKKADQKDIAQSGSGALLQPKPSYASMLAAVKEIANPISFKCLKAFYGLA